MAKGVYWKQAVAHGSTLWARATPTDEPDVWNADLFIHSSSGELADRYNNEDLRNGIAFDLDGVSPRHYLGQLIITFAAPSSARIEMAVLKPDGTTPHGKKYDEVHEGDVSDAVAILVFMK